MPHSLAKVHRRLGEQAYLLVWTDGKIMLVPDEGLRRVLGIGPKSKAGATEAEVRLLADDIRARPRQFRARIERSPEQLDRDRRPGACWSDSPGGPDTLERPGGFDPEGWEG